MHACSVTSVMSNSLWPHGPWPAAPLSMGFSRQEYWSGLPFPFPVIKYEVSEVKSLSRVQLFSTPWILAYQAPPSMGFSRPEYWSGVSFPPPQTDNRSFYNQKCACMCSSAWLFATPWTVPARLSCPRILQARILEWVFIPHSRGFSRPRNKTCISGIGRGIILPVSHLGSTNTQIYGSHFVDIPNKQAKILAFRRLENT